MELSLFDLHCDTAYEMHKQGVSLAQNGLAVSLAYAKAFTHYVQVMALWTDHSLSDEEGWNAYVHMLDHLMRDISVTSKRATVYGDGMGLPTAHTCLILAVEDARILNRKLERLTKLYLHGVRILTPCWKGISSIGGAHDTDVGLTPFGKSVIREALSLGMIVDISHASYQTADEIFAMCESLSRPVIASHSNAFDVCPVSRNLKKEQIERVRRCGGVIGLNLYPHFLREGGGAHLSDVLPHLDYFLALGMEDHLCLGCDMDGANMPPEIQNVSHLPRFAELLLQNGYSEALICKLFYQNAFRFFDSCFSS